MLLRADLTNQTFGRWTVLTTDTSRKSNYWLCRCSCGKQKSVRANHLTGGNSRSCGCLRDTATGDRQRTHGQSQTPLYLVWRAMLARCYLPNCKEFEWYGGRGIRVCDDWRTSFENFSRDVAKGYSKGLWLDRRDNNGHYCKDNCQWRTPSEQCRNRRDNRLFEFDGKTRCLAEIVEITKTRYNFVHERLSRGWSLHDALYQPHGTILKAQRA